MLQPEPLSMEPTLLVGKRANEGASFITLLPPGESLHVLQQKPLKESLRLALELCSILEFLHQNGIVHRDLKPENVLINEGGLYLKGFEQAKILGAKEPPSKKRPIMIGTPGYAAPEQLR